MAVLQQVFGQPPLPAFQLSPGTTTIGRHEGNDIVVESAAVSRFHAHISCEGNRYFLEDLNSRNGTLVNAHALKKKTLLADGDLIEFSTLPFTFQSQDSLAEASGSWGIKANVISISGVSGIGEQSIRRQVVGQGDRIPANLLESDSLRESQLVSSVPVLDSGATWPVLHQAPQKLNYTLRMLHCMRRTIKTDEVIARSLQSLFEMFPSAERIAIVLRDESKTGVRVAAAVSRSEEGEVEVCLPVVRMCLQNSNAILYVDHWKAKGVDNPELENPSMRSILATPMIGLVGEMLGVIQMDTTNTKSPFRGADLEMLVVLSHVIAFGMEQTAASETEVNNAVLERSTANADQLRTSLTSSSPPRMSGFRLFSGIIAAPDIAADFIDFVRLSDGRVACLLIDVPGRGQNAANLMAVIARVLSSAVTETGSAAESIQLAELRLRERMTEVPMVCSVAILILDTETSLVSVAVAGHCPLYMIHGDNLREITWDEVGGPPLGGERSESAEIQLKLENEDLLLLFSDGVTKLRSPADNGLTPSLRAELIESCAGGSRTLFEKRLRNRLNEFRGESPLADDVAFAIIHKTRNAETVELIPAGIESEDRSQ